MSHLKERSEKNCLNCNTQVEGRFCQNCGQENIEAKESVWHLITHFFQDITHFDGKFFSTVKYLFTKPGYLSTEYMIGRRASYVNPVRLYIFTSAFFFLIFFSFMKIDKKTITNDVQMNGKTFAEAIKLDSLAFDAYTKSVNQSEGHGPDPMTKEEFKHYFDSSVMMGRVHFTDTDYKTKEQYDSVLSSGKKKHNWLQKQLIYKEIELNEKYNNEGGNILREYVNILLHSLPQMFFVLLPLFALILKLLYIRRKDYYYVNHAIFSIHFYTFWFITMLLMFFVGRLNDKLHWAALTYLEFFMGLGIFFYLYKAMRKFYKQRRAKTIIKFFTFCFLLLITMSLLFLVFIIYSLFKL